MPYCPLSLCFAFWAKQNDNRDSKDQTTFSLHSLFLKVHPQGFFPEDEPLSERMQKILLILLYRIHSLSAITGKE